MTIKIENYDEQPPGSNAVAVFDIYDSKDTRTSRRIKLCISKNGRHFIGWPSYVSSEDSSTGKKNFSKYSELCEEKQREVEDQIFAELAPFVRGPIQRFTKR